MPAFLSAPALRIGICSAVDLLIVESVGPYRVLNKYEQPLSPEEKDDFPTNVPFVVVDRDATLGDQLTPAMIVTYKGIRYYFQKDAEDGLIEASTGGYRRIFRNVVETDDTVQLKRQTTLHTRYPASGNEYRIREGVLLVRLFQTGGYYYAHPTSDPSQFGWVRLSRNDWTEPSSAAPTQAPAKTALNEDVRRRIITHIDQSNEIYALYFSSLNQVTTQDKAVPRWTVHSEGPDGITFALSGGVDIISSLDESSRILAEELGNILLAEQFTAQYRDGIIRVHRRGGGKGTQ